jgi:hypothetical protein
LAKIPILAWSSRQLSSASVRALRRARKPTSVFRVGFEPMIEILAFSPRMSCRSDPVRRLWATPERTASEQQSRDQTVRMDRERTLYFDMRLQEQIGSGAHRVMSQMGQGLTAKHVGSYGSFSRKRPQGDTRLVTSSHAIRSGVDRSQSGVG